MRHKPRKIKSPQHLLKLWDDYKKYCDEHTVMKTQFSSHESRFISDAVPSPITYTIKGFSIYNGWNSWILYDTYNELPEYKEALDLIRLDCESDARRKFETGSIPASLAPLWMGNYDGYTQKQENRVTISNDDETIKNMENYFKEKRDEESKNS